MEYVLVALAGWVGSGWPVAASSRGRGGAGLPNPDDPNPPLCWVCGLVVGAVAAVIFWALLGRQIAPDGGLIPMVLVGFLAGSAGASLVGGVLDLAGRGKKTGV
jgi:hypothetical protein